MKPLTMILIAVVGLLTLTGCTSFVADIPGMGKIIQPKDVTFEGLEWVTNPDGSAKLKIKKYTSSANVAAVQAQTALIQGVVETAVSTAVKAALPVAAAPAPAPAVGVLAADGKALTAVETTRIVPGQ